jgi:hypothetical protein
MPDEVSATVRPPNTECQIRKRLEVELGPAEKRDAVRPLLNLHAGGQLPSIRQIDGSNLPVMVIA